MRITNMMMTTQYIHSLNSLTRELNRSRVQVETGRKFSKSSENTSAAIKAFQIRKDLSKAEGYKGNIAYAKSRLTDSESALFHMNELMQTAYEKIDFALNGTQTNSERTIIATELRNIQDQLFQTLNSISSDSYYFGGTNTSTRPFELADGKLQYNGYPLDFPLSGDSAETNEALLDTLRNNSMFLDIGLNVEFDSATGIIDGSTVFGYSIPGINIVGSGTVTVDGEKVSCNLYDLLGTIINELESDDYNYYKANDLLGHLRKMGNNIGNCITEIGAKSSYLDFMLERTEDRVFNLKEKQVDVEGIDIAEAMIDFETQKFAYIAALQMGTKVIQPTVFDYMM